MTGWADQLGGRSRLGEFALWTGAGIVVLAAHVGGIAWALREPSMTMADNSPPPAIMIELAPTPEAVQTEANEVAPDQAVTQEFQSERLEPFKELMPDVKPEPTDKVEEKTTVEPMPEEPGERIAEAEPEKRVEEVEEVDPIEQNVLAQLENVEVPLPTFRPSPRKKLVVKKEKPKKKPDKKRKTSAVASHQQTQAQAQVTRSNRNAAASAVSGTASSMSPARWQSRLMSHLERRKRYPAGARSRGETGVAYARFRIDDAGNVLSATLARSSGFPELDSEVVNLVRRASPVPAPPPGVNRTITAPVQFSIR